jgi:Tfp pilus assembly protein PilW
MNHGVKAPSLRSSQGSVMVQVLIAAAVSILVVLAIAQMSVQMARFESHSQVKLTLFEIRNNLLSTLLNDVAWTNTINHADNTAAVKAVCLTETNGDTPPAIDCSGAGGALTLVDGSNVVEIAAVAPTSGFTRRGEVCNTFNAVNGNSQCPIHIDVRWDTECSAPCNMRVPPLKVSVQFRYNDPDSMSRINPNNINFMLRR